MAALEEGHFELDGLVFGGSRLGPIFVENHDTGVAEWMSQDKGQPFSGVRMFGRDTLEGPTWTFTLNIISPDENSQSSLVALNALETLARHWRAMANSKIPGATSVLRYTRAGRTRRVYGRPRRFAYNPNKVKKGVLTVEAEFVTADPYHYDDDYSSLDMSIAPPVGTGVDLPVILPVTLAPPSVRQGVIANSGADAPTPVKVTFYGPISAPYIQGRGWRLGTSGVIREGERVTMDSNPANLSVKHSSGANWIGRIDRYTLFQDVRIPPGSSEVTFGGTDPTGISRALIEWQPAHYAL